MIGQIISHYRILEQLGCGGMGVVYKAEDTRLNRIIALKFLPPELTRDKEAKQRFIHEAQAASSLQHHNICTIHDIDETEDGQMFICMDSYEGETLKGKITKGPLKIDETINIAIQLAEGLQCAHDHGIIHRDIKPANIFITKAGEVKILDFGLAKLTGRSIITKMGSTVGTVDYMSPEQTRGENIDHRTDIWSFGIVLYEMLTGELPFKGDYEQAVIYSIINEEPEFISKIRSDVPQQFEKIISKSLNKNSVKRFSDVKEIKEALEHTSEEIKTGNVKTVYRFKLGRKQKRILYLITAVLILFLAAVIYTKYNSLNLKTVSIALLPLQNISKEADQDWFTDGMTEALITDLAKISGLRVISRSSVMKFKGSDKTSSEIAQALGVSYVIEGSILKINNQIKITTRLIDAARDVYLWAQEYNRDFKDILSLQSEVAQSIAGQIKVKITPSEQTLLSVHHEINPEAYESYLRGNFYWYKLNQQSLETALKYYNLSAEIDSQCALAYAGIASVWIGRAQNGYASPQVAYGKGKAAAIKALGLDSTLGEVHYMLAGIKAWGEWNWKEAENEFKEAIKLNPNLAEARASYSHLLFVQKRSEEGAKQIKIAIELDPFNTLFQGLYAMSLMYLYRYDDVINMLEKIRLTEPEAPLALSTLKSAYHQKGMHKKALEIWRAAFTLNKDYEAVEALDIGNVKGGYSAALQSVAELMIKRSKTKYVTPWQIATLYTRAGMKKEALDWFEKAYEVHDPNMPYLNIDPIFDDLRNDPRFKDLIKKTGL